MSWEMKSVKRFAILSIFFVLVFGNSVWAIWVDADGSGQESINISTNTGASGWPSLYLDSSENPHIAWEDNSLGDGHHIYYLKWNGTAWVDADGSGQESINIPKTSGSSYRASLCLDSSGNPHIAWKDYASGNYDIYYLKWNNAPALSWTGETNYASDGLDPEAGYPNTDFVYRVKYTDQDNDAPASGYPKLHIMKGGKEISGSPFTMSEVDAGDKTYSDGKLYTYTKSGLAPGTDYTYYFEAKDVWNTSATGEPTNPVDAPDVRLGLSAQGVVKIQGGKNGYVNPLKGEQAEIHFWPSAPGTVAVEIFDLIGLLVWEKSKAVTGAQDSIKWNCRNSENDLVASGIYVVFVKGPGIKATKKVAVMK